MMKSERIRLIYAIFLSLFVVAVGAAFIGVAADIYYSGKGTGVIYSQAIVSGRLKAFIAPMVLLIVAIIVGGIFPLYEVKAKRNSEDTLKKLQPRMPAFGEGEQYDEAEKSYGKTAKIRLTVWLCALAVTLACVIASLCYVCDATHFKGEDIYAEMLGLVKNVLPFVAVSFVIICAASVYNGIAAQKQLTALKAMIKYGDKDASRAPKSQSVAKEITAHKATLWSVRATVFVIAVTFIVLGIVNGGAHDVLIKAINICQECIGLG